MLRDLGVRILHWIFPGICPPAGEPDVGESDSDTEEQVVAPPEPKREKRTYLNGDRLTKYEEDLIYSSQRCPDCGKGRLMRGPSGGGSQNYRCDNEDCGSSFNEMGIFGWQRISDASPNKRTPLHTRGPHR